MFPSRCIARRRFVLSAAICCDANPSHSATSRFNDPGKIDRGVAVSERKRRSRGRIFFRGLSEELIAALAQIKDLKVIGRSSSFRFKGKNEESRTIGEKLGVSTLLEGTVRKRATGCESSPN